jgi:flagellar motor switch/type III secretory pathway protein FliN
MDNDAAAPTLAAAGRRDSIVGDGAVELVVSFPPIVMSVAEVEALRRGSVLEIGKRLVDTELSIRADGQPVARGYLVALVGDLASVVLSRIEA